MCVWLGGFCLLFFFHFIPLFQVDFRKIYKKRGDFGRVWAFVCFFVVWVLCFVGLLFVVLIVLLLLGRLVVFVVSCRGLFLFFLSCHFSR